VESDFCKDAKQRTHDREDQEWPEGGPTFKMRFALLWTVSTRPAADVLAFLDAAIVNLIIGNCDAHGKNLSLLYQAGETRLAPLYDLMSTIAYPEVSAIMAMKIGGVGDLDAMTKETWSRFANEAGLGVPFFLRAGGGVGVLDDPDG
jgi:serine/threonine-protein kinase HipA